MRILFVRALSILDLCTHLHTCSSLTLLFFLTFLTLPLRHFYFFFNDTATTEIYTLSLHDALPISKVSLGQYRSVVGRLGCPESECRVQIHCPWDPCNHGKLIWTLHSDSGHPSRPTTRSEEHTSELQSHSDLVCRLLLAKKQ